MRRARLACRGPSRWRPHACGPPCGWWCATAPTRVHRAGWRIAVALGKVGTGRAGGAWPSTGPGRGHREMPARPPCGAGRPSSRRPAQVTAGSSAAEHPRVVPGRVEHAEVAGDNPASRLVGCVTLAHFQTSRHEAARGGRAGRCQAVARHIAATGAHACGRVARHGARVRPVACWKGVGERCRSAARP